MCLELNAHVERGNGQSWRVDRSQTGRDIANHGKELGFFPPKYMSY